MKINIHFLIFLSISLVALLNDYIIYTTRISYIISLVISSLLILLLNIILVKKRKIKIETNWNNIDIVFYLILLVFLFYIISTPDYSYDVSNYHIYLQTHFPIDKINFDFFAGKSINGFLFPLGDRMFYIFRYFLGYRMGTILSYYAAVVIYYQCKRLLSFFSDKYTIVSIFSLVCTFSSQIMMQWLGTYYIDIFSVTFILTIINTLLSYHYNNDNKKNTILLLGLLSGLSTAIKVPNMILIGPIIILGLFILKPKKEDIKYIIISIIIFLLCFSLYAYDNYVQTGSILFPYYNNIFKSKYFNNYSWVDSRFNIPNILYAMIWPIYVGLFHVGYGDDVIILDPIWAIGYIFLLIIMLVYIFKKKTKTPLFLFFLLSLLLTIFWIMFLYGYMRYALIIPILYSIIICIQILRYININKDTSVKKWVVYSLLIVVLPISDNLFFYHKPLNISNYKLLLKDNKNIKIHIDGVWGTISDSSVLPILVREEETPIYNLSKDYLNTDITKELYYKKINSSDIYMIIDDNTLSDKKRLLNKDGFELGEIIKVYSDKDLPFLPANKKAYLYKLKKKTS